MQQFSDSEVRQILQEVERRPSEELESETVEFKGFANSNALNNSRDLPEELSALANLKGGIIIAGVRDNRDVTYGCWEDQLRGIDGADPLEIKERLAGKLRPSVQLEVRLFEFEGKEYLCVDIRQSLESLVSTSSGKTCIREGRSSRPMSPDEIERAVKALTRYDWSNDFPNNSGLDQLDAYAVESAVSDFAQKRGLESHPPLESYLEAVGASLGGRITRGGLMFLGKESAIRDELGVYEFRFTWKTRSGVLHTNDVWFDNVWNTVRRASDHFKKCNSYHTFRVGQEDFKAPLLDEVAFHEAFLNAVVHRDYSVDGITSVTFSGDRLRIHSPGTFFGGVTSDNIARHEPRHRNKNLARILMTHHLVDRAGMGVLRMGLGSLKYGRAFPEFREQSNAVEVELEAQYIRPAIAVLGIRHLDNWGVPELLILNSVFESGVVTVLSVEKMLERLVEAPFSEIKRAVTNIPQVELCGTKDGLFIRVIPQWKSFLDVGRIFRSSPISDKYVKLYEYLKAHGEASNTDLTELLNYNHSSQTSKFLRETRFVYRTGHGPTARWRIDSAATR